MQRRAISTIIASVLTVLITVAAVTLLWVGIQPLLSGAAFIDPIDVIFSIEKENSFTFYDDERGYLSVQIQRGSDDDDPQVIALKFLINIEGNTITRKTYQVMPPNQRVVYYFLVGFVEEVDSVKVVPIYYVDGKEVEGQTFTIDAKIPKRGGELLGEIPIIEIDDDPDIPFSDGLVLYYSFDDGFVENGFVLDETGKGHDGEITNAIQDDDPERGKVMKFDGDEDYLTVLNGVDLASKTGGDKTITFWAKFECPVTDTFDSPFGSYQNYYVSFYDVCSPSTSELWIGSGGLLQEQGNWYSSGWHHFVFVFYDDLDQIFIFQDGAQSLNSPYSSTIDSASVKSNFYVGTNSDSGGGANEFSYFEGSLDNLRIYNRVLDSEEISALHDYELNG